MKTRFGLVALVAVALTAGCGGPSQEDFDGANASVAALESAKDSLTADLENAQAQLDQTKSELEKTQSELSKFQEEDEKRQQAEAEAKAKKEQEKKEKEAKEKEKKKKAAKAKKITKRELARIVKNPDGHVGEGVIVYGRVTQFDTATGDCTFRADISHAQVGKYSYEHNSFFIAGDGLFTCEGLDDIVADDIVQIRAVVSGSLSYDTTIGGNVTVPKFEVTKVKRL